MIFHKKLKNLVGIFSLIVLVWLVATTRIPTPPTVAPCSDQWFSSVEDRYFSTERNNSFGDSVGLDWSAGNGARWFDYIENRAKMPHPSVALSKVERCRLIQNHLASRVYLINDLTGAVLSFKRLSKS
jgi:hypothetical protein